MKRYSLTSKSNLVLFFFISTVFLLIFLICGISTNAQQIKIGGLFIDSNPRGARVYLDNAYKGETPLDLKNVNPGQYSIRLSLPGYQDWSTTVIALPILTVKVTANLTPKEERGLGSVSINSNRQGADVYLDGKYVGLTPLNLQNISTGRHRIDLSLPDYDEWADVIEVAASKTERVFVELLPQLKYGSLSIYCEQEDAKVFLNGSYQADTKEGPTVLEDLEVGDYELVIIKEEFRAWVGDMEIYPDEVTSVDIIMTPISGKTLL